MCPGRLRWRVSVPWPEHGGHLALAAGAAGSALAELGASLGGDLNLGHGGFSSVLTCDAGTKCSRQKQPGADPSIRTRPRSRRLSRGWSLLVRHPEAVRHPKAVRHFELVRHLELVRHPEPVRHPPALRHLEAVQDSLFHVHMTISFRIP